MAKKQKQHPKTQPWLNLNVATSYNGNLRDQILGGVCWLYLWAFASLYHQLPGLYGDGGILPVRTQMPCDEKKDLLKCALLGDKPNGLYVIRYLTNASASDCMEMACLLGIVLASLGIVFRKARDMIVLGTLWFAYLSVFQVGRTFLWFQWDTLLIELGLLAAVLAPLRIVRSVHLPHDNLVMFLVRWLAFRLMFASGIVKLQSECPTWWGLTALTHHFESQCLPTAVAWYAHNLPAWILRLATVVTYVVEIVMPLWFLVPIKCVRKTAFYSQVLLMAGIVATGNYNFFNVAYVVACMAMLANSSGSALDSGAFVTRKLGKWPTRIGKTLVIGAIFGATLYAAVVGFSLKFVLNSVDPAKSSITSKISFTKTEFNAAVALVVPATIVVGVYLFVTEVLVAFARCFTDSRSTMGKLGALVSFIPVALVSTLLFSVSLVPFASLLPRASPSPLPSQLYEWHRVSDKFHVTNAYGLFRSMTGVGGRPEIVVEGADSEKGPWVVYEFNDKPGALDKMPTFVMPHQPRLDWQMWFAALSEFKKEAWFASFAHRLLSNQPDVIALLTKNPFTGRAPKYVRATSYKYSFTSPNSTPAVNWWTRKETQAFMPPMSLESEVLLNFIDSTNLQIRVDKSSAHSMVKTVISTCRDSVAVLPAAQFVWALSVAAVVMRRLLRRA